MLSEVDVPGESICSVARRYEIDPAQMYQWRKKFRDREASPPVMLPVEIADTVASCDETKTQMRLLQQPMLHR